MPSYKVSSLTQRDISIFSAITLTYFFCGLFGLQLAIHPGYATAIWPPAGIALAAVLICGNKISLAVLLGSFLVNNWINYQATGTINQTGGVVAFIIGVGAATQAYIGAKLVRKYIGFPNPLITDQSILLFLVIGGPVSCLINATVGVGALLVSGIASPDYALTQWATWWIGDTIGVLIFTPLIFTFVAEPRNIWHSRKLTVFIPLFLCFLTVLSIFYFAAGWEQSNNLQNTATSSTNWNVLAGGLLFTGFLGGFLLVLTGRSSMIENEVNSRTNELEKINTQLSHEIKEHQLTKKKIVQQQAFLQRVIDTAPNFIFVKDRTGRFILGNRAVAEAYGSTVENLIGKFDSDFNPNKDEVDHFHKDDLEVIDHRITKIIPEEKVTTAAGELRWLQTIKLPLTNEQGITDQLLGVSTDITELKLQQQKHLYFLESLERIDLAIQQAKDVEQLMSDVLKVTEEIFNTDRTWLLYPCDPDAEAWTVPMECTKPEYPGVNPGEFIPTTPEVAKVFRNGLDKNDVIVIDYKAPDSAQEIAGQYTIQAEIHMALRPQTGNAWMFGVHQCSYIREWTDDEINLFREIGHRLTDGLSSLIFMRDLQQSEQRFRTLLEASPVAVYETDAQGACLYVNENWQKLAGLTLEESLGDGWKASLYEEDRDHVFHQWQQNIHNHKSWDLEYRFCTPEGKISWVMGKASALRNAQGHITGYLGVNVDITERKRTDDLLTFQASHDVLTGLNNRREFEHRTERLLSKIQQDKSEHALCFMDLDQFKIINDTCGHNAGDELLRQLGQILQEKVRSRDTLARLGGDEFGILIENCTLNQAQLVANSLQEAVQNYQFIWQGQSFKIGASIGLVAITKTTLSLTELLKQADAACYMAKDMGRNRIHVHHEDDTDAAERRGEMQWVTRIQQALEKDLFCLYAQAIVPLDNSTTTHYELLIRMLDKNNKIIPPGAFLPAAERYKLIEEVDCWVVNHAFSLLAKHPAFLKQITFCSINLSGPSLANPQMLDFIIRQFNEKDIECTKICFEITETAAISNLNLAMTFISTLKKLGCLFALDDFGSGLSSFGYLKNLPVDYLKIDGMFVKDIVDDPIDHAMVKSINEIGQIMGMQTIAEFVENEKIKSMLKKIGVNYAQGYGIGMPVLFDQLLAQSTNNIKGASIN